jgi:outer membrane protein assembly factor BamB
MTRANSSKVVSAAFFLCAAIAHAAPTISLSKNIGPPTSEIRVFGSGFEPNVGVDIYFDTKDEALVVTNNEGEFHNAKIHAPVSAYPGEHWVTALERNDDKGDQEPFVVNTDWPQFDFDSSHDSFNPYENVLNRSNVGNLELRWSRSGGYPLYSTPALVDGTLYTASEDGNVYALDAEHGGIRWEFDTGSYAQETPAIADGVVYIGSCAGSIFARNARTGDPVWTYSTPNCVDNPPVITQGIVYISGEGLYALDAETGTLLWETGGYLYAPAVADGVLCVVSRSEGTLYAFNARTGTPLWSSTLLFDQNPQIADGVVYLSRSYSDLYALNLRTGQLLWTYAGNIQSPKVLGHGRVYVQVGTDLVALDGATGATVWQSPLQQGIDNPTVAGEIIYAGSTGGLRGNGFYAFDARTGSLLWQYPIAQSVEFTGMTVANGMVYGNAGNAIYVFSLPGLGESQRRAKGRPPDIEGLRPDLALQPLLTVPQAVN